MRLRAFLIAACLFITSPASAVPTLVAGTGPSGVQFQWNVSCATPSCSIALTAIPQPGDVVVVIASGGSTSQGMQGCAVSDGVQTSEFGTSNAPPGAVAGPTFMSVCWVKIANTYTGLPNVLITPYANGNGIQSQAVIIRGIDPAAPQDWVAGTTGSKLSNNSASSSFTISTYPRTRQSEFIFGCFNASGGAYSAGTDSFTNATFTGGSGVYFGNIGRIRCGYAIVDPNVGGTLAVSYSVNFSVSAVYGGIMMVFQAPVVNCNPSNKTLLGVGDC